MLGFICLNAQPAVVFGCISTQSVPISESGGSTMMSIYICHVHTGTIHSIHYQETNKIAQIYNRHYSRQRVYCLSRHVPKQVGGDLRKMMYASHITCNHSLITIIQEPHIYMSKNQYLRSLNICAPAIPTPIVMPIPAHLHSLPYDRR